VAATAFGWTNRLHEALTLRRVDEKDLRSRRITPTAQRPRPRIPDPSVSQRIMWACRYAHGKQLQGSNNSTGAPVDAGFPVSIETVVSDSTTSCGRVFFSGADSIVLESPATSPGPLPTSYFIQSIICHCVSRMRFVRFRKARQLRRLCKFCLLDCSDPGSVVALW